MAASVPPSLRSADIARFALRAAQLEKAKPVVAYWCDYWIANQILSKGLHNADDESLKYTTDLMDKLEKVKRDNAGNDAILDDVAGRAYVEQFGLETFQRADNTMRADKVTRQTADTFQASATFLELCQIWGPLDPEIASKIKFAKYHALRIAKALKAGEDPNLTNPKQEPEEKDDLPALDANDPEVQMLGGSEPNPRQPSVEDVGDENDRLEKTLARRSTLDESLHPSRASSLPRQPVPAATDPQPPPPPNVESYYTGAPASTAEPDVSPVEPPMMDRQLSQGGGYFPQVPSDSAGEKEPELPSAPSDISPPSPAEGLPKFEDEPPSFNQIRPPSPPSIPQMPPQPPVAPIHPPTHPFGLHGQTPRQAPRVPHVPPSVSQPRDLPSVAPRVPPYAPPPSAPAAAPPVEVDEEAMMKAQKHARWAISALNFEDVPTAIKELRNALQTLGG